MKRPTCPWCNPLRIDNYPELEPSGYSDPKIYRCPRGSSCKGLKDRPPEFNYFDADGKPIPYTPPTKHTAGYSPGKAHDPKKIVKNPWKNTAIDGEGENPGKMFSFEQHRTERYMKLSPITQKFIENTIKNFYLQSRIRNKEEVNNLIYNLAEIYDTNPGRIRIIWDRTRARGYEYTDRPRRL